MNPAQSRRELEDMKFEDMKMKAREELADAFAEQNGLLQTITAQKEEISRLTAARDSWKTVAVERQSIKAEFARLQAKLAEATAELELRDRTDGVCSRSACKSVREDMARYRLALQKVANGCLHRRDVAKSALAGWDEADA